VNREFTRFQPLPSLALIPDQEFLQKESLNIQGTASDRALASVSGEVGTHGVTRPTGDAITLPAFRHES